MAIRAPSKRSSLPLSNLSDSQRQAFQTHLNTLYDDYLEEVANLIIEAKTMVANATYDEGDPLENAQAQLAQYARQANLIAQDYYRNVRSAWALAAHVKLPDFQPAQVTSDRAAWQVFGGFNDTDFAGLKFTDVINGRAKSGVTMQDLWAKKTADYDDAQWEQLAKDIINSTTRLTQQLTAEKDPSEPRYARVPSGPTCTFCIMLASRGYVYWSDESAGKFNGYHRDDNCQIVSSWGKTRINGYDPDAMKKRYTACREGIDRLLTKTRYEQYRALAEENGDDVYRFDEWVTRQVLAEMRWRDPQWLYDGTEPPISFPSAAMREETEKARPQEIRTAERLRKHGITPAFQVDFKMVRNEETGIEERVGLADWAHGVEIKTPQSADKFRTIDSYIGSASKKSDCTRLVIDNTENPNMSDDQLVGYINDSNRFHDGKIYILTKEEKLRRIK